MKRKNNIARLDPVSIGRRALFALLLCCALFSRAQQIPVFSAYHFNKYLINPGFTGIDNQYRAFGFFRSQWGKMPGKPVTGGATAEASLWKDRMGIGLFIMDDKTGIFRRDNVALAYAYKFRFAKHHQISLGVQAGAFVNRIDFTRATTHDLFDPLVAENKPVKTVFDMNAGIGYKWKGLLVGFAIPNVLQPMAKYSTPSNNTATYQFVRHYVAYASYRVGIANEMFNITPSLMMKKGPASGYQFDATVFFDYKNMAFIGAGYRNYFGAIVLAGVNIEDIVTLSYAFDFTTQRTLKGQVGSTHEITAGFHFPTNYKSRTRLLDVLKEKEDSIEHVKTQNARLNKKLKTTQTQLDTATARLKGAEQSKTDLNRFIDSLKKADKVKKKPTTSEPFRLQDAEKNKDVSGSSFTLDKIYFENEKYTLLPESMSQLDSLATFLNNNKGVTILIKGYTDNVGSDKFNQNLSEQRAKAVADYLISKEIDGGRVLAVGLGNKEPVGDNNTEEGRQKNRRVEFMILKN